MAWKTGTVKVESANSVLLGLAIVEKHINEAGGIEYWATFRQGHHIIKDISCTNCTIKAVDYAIENNLKRVVGA